MMYITIKKISLISLLALATALTACSKSEPTEKNADNLASAAEAQAMPMSAAPADENNAPVVINDSNATADLGSDIADSNASNVADTAVTPEAGEPAEAGVDNSAMETISENDQVIDDEPASPNAPKANDNSADVNQKVR